MSSVASMLMSLKPVIDSWPRVMVVAAMRELSEPLVAPVPKGIPGRAIVPRRRRPVTPCVDYTRGVPIYEYVCMSCEHHFEELVRNGEQPACPDCGTANVTKKFSAFATIGASGQPSFGQTAAGGGGCCGGSCGCGH